MCVQRHCTAFVCGVFVQFRVISHACCTIPMGQVHNRLWVLRQSHNVDTTSFYEASNVFAFVLNYERNDKK